MHDIFARRLWVDSGATVQMATPVTVQSTVGYERHPSIAARPDSDEYLIAWEQQFTSTTGPFGIHSRTLDSNNFLGEIISIRTVFTGIDIDSSNPIVIPTDPRGWFVIWDQERNSSPNYSDVFGRAVLASLFADGFESGDLSQWSASSL